MLKCQKILARIAATHAQRTPVEEAERGKRLQEEWECRREADDSIPQQARYPGPKLSDLVKGMATSDPKRWVQIMNAIRVRGEERSQPC